MGPPAAANCHTCATRTPQSRVEPPSPGMRETGPGASGWPSIRPTILTTETPSLRYVALGETDEIGGSCHLLMAGGTGLMLDTGVHPDRDGVDGLPRLDIPAVRPDLHVDHVIVTHAHHDHLGALPVVLQRFPHALVHMTKATRTLSEFLLRASARLQKRRIREGSSTEDPLFLEDELEFHEYLYLAHDLGVSFDVAGVRDHTPVRATFHHAGHVLGAALIDVAIGEGEARRRVVYTGDVHLRNQVLTPAADLPEGPVDVLILESTLGADPVPETTSRKTEEERMGRALQEVIAGGGSVLIPVFALGRAQEMVAIVDRFKRRGLIPADTPVVTAGSMRALAEITDATRHTTPRLDAEIVIGDIPQVRYPRSSTAVVNALATPSIFILSSGMLFERTPSNDLAQYLVDQAKHGIFLVGFAKEDSPGGRLLAAAASGDPDAEVTFDPQTGPQAVACRVERFRFSGHAHRQDLLRVVSTLQPKTVVLVHGEEAAKDWLEGEIRRFHPETRVVRPKQGETVDL